MRNCVPFLLLALAPYAGAETLPRFLNSNDSMQTLPTPNLPVDAYRPAAPALELPKPAAAQPRPLEMGTRLTIRKLQIEGGTIYPLPELGAVYKPLLGHEITLAELIEATRKITKRYQDDGYLLSYAFLPQQNFDQGLVRVVLVEGYISEYKVDGDIGRVKGFVDELVDKLKGERPLTRKTFNRYSTLLSRIPGVTLEAQVPPPGTTDGASTLSISASRKPFTTSMSLVEGNRSSTQALLAASSNSQTAMAEQLTLSGLFPPGNDKEHYYRLDYSQYLNAEGTQLNLFGSSYRSDPSTAVKLVFRLNPFLENILHKPPATLVGTVVVAITRMASDLVASAVNTRNWLLLVLRVPQVVFTFCTLPGVKLLRVALWLAKPAAVLAPAQLPPRLTASSTAISATRCNLRCSRYRRPLSTTSSINSSTMPSVTAAMRPIAPCCCRGP